MKTVKKKIVKPRKDKFSVKVTEHDRWSGPDSFIVKFKTLKKAQSYVNEINGENTLPSAPDYYLTAENPQPI